MYFFKINVQHLEVETEAKSLHQTVGISFKTHFTEGSVHFRRSFFIPKTNGMYEPKQIVPLGPETRVSYSVLASCDFAKNKVSVALADGS